MAPNNSKTAASSLLAREFKRRIATLGLSRRDVVKRTGLSRQTLHNIEHHGQTDLRASTLVAIDSGLRWKPGTALALSQGNASVLEDADAMTVVDREASYRWGIVERIQGMSLEELERMIALIESEAEKRDSSINGQ